MARKMGSTLSTRRIRGKRPGGAESVEGMGESMGAGYPGPGGPF
jgi:hypothetical protein